mgnify:CR=1 FL=1
MTNQLISYAHHNLSSMHLQVIFMTDGGVSGQRYNIEQLLHTHEQKAKTTILTLGIGQGVNRELVDMVAEITGEV